MVEFAPRSPLRRAQPAFVRPTHRTVAVSVLFAFVLGATTMSFAQQPVDQLVTQRETVSDPSGDYTVEHTDYLFNNAPGLLRLQAFTVGAQTFTPAPSTPRVQVLRVDNAQSSGQRLRYFAEGEIKATKIPLVPPRPFAAEEIMASDIVNRGLVDVFLNQKEGRHSANNIERIDVLFDNALDTSANVLTSSGFLLLEKSGNNPVQVAAVIALDAVGNPAAYGPLLKIGTSRFRHAASDFEWVTLESQANESPAGSGDNGLPVAIVQTNEAIGATFVSLADLGVDSNTDVFGYSLIPLDVDPAVHDLTDVHTYPTDTRGSTTRFEGREGTGADFFGGMGALYKTTPPASGAISGVVFEDPNYGGGLGRNFTEAQDSALASGLGGVGLAGVRVELYDDSGLRGAVETDVDGHYRFEDLDPAPYIVRVVSATVGSARGGANALSVVTFQSDGATEVRDVVGGPSPHLPDPGPVEQLGAPLPEFAHARTQIVVATSVVENVSFGFNFNTITNTNDAGQGSLRQFILNANVLANDALAQVGAQPGTETSMFMVPAADLINGVATIVLSSPLPAVVGASTVLDGTTQTTNVGDTNPGQLGTGGTVGVDALPLARCEAPEVEIDGGGQAVPLKVSADGVVIRGIAFFNAGGRLNHADPFVDLVSGVDLVVDQNLFGLRADGSDPGPLRNVAGGLRAASTVGAVVTNNCVAYNGSDGMRLGIEGFPTANELLVTGNECWNNGSRYFEADQFALYRSDAVVRGNLFRDAQVSNRLSPTSGGAGLEIGFNVDRNLVENNTFLRCLSHGLVFKNDADDNLVRKNRFEDTVDGAGVVVTERGSGVSSGNRLSQNVYLNNHGLGIDVLSGTSNQENSGDGVTFNDGQVDSSEPNDNLDFPVLTAATLDAGVLTITGYVGNAPADPVFADLVLEFYRSSYDGSSNPNPGAANDGPPYHGEGAAYLGQGMTNAADGSFVATLTGVGGLLPNGSYITATASRSDAGPAGTDAGSTSEFSENFLFQGGGNDASIGVAKNMTATGNGPFAVMIDYYFENFGNVSVTDLSMTDDLDEVFGAGNWTLSAGPSLVVGPNTFTVQPAYTGTGNDIELLGGGSLGAGETAQVQIALTVTAPGSYLNQTIVTGEDPDGDPVTDVSTDGTDPDADGDDTDGTVDDDGNPDENDPSPLTLDSGVIGVAKNMFATGTGPFDVTIDYYFENFGTLDLSGLSMTDDLDEVFTAGNWSLTSGPDLLNGPATFTVDATYTGGGATIELLGGGSFAPGETAQVRITLSVNDPGTYTNQTIVNAITPAGDPVSDVSTAGTDPDADGDDTDGTEDDDDNPDEDDPTTLTLPPATIGVAKNMAATGNGPFDVTIDYYFENFAGVALSNLTMTDDLDEVFGVGNWSLTTGPALISGPATFTVDNAYTGSGPTIELLGGGSLDVGETAQVQVTLSVTAPGSYLNQTTVSGETPTGDPVTDVSTNGTDPDADGDDTDGTVDNDGNPDEDDPSPLTLQTGVIGVAKDMFATGTGPFDVTIDYYFENFGTVDLLNLSMTDDLDEVFTAGNWSLTSGPQLLSGPASFTVDASYTGSGPNIELLGGGSFAPGETAQVRVTLSVTDPGTYTNQTIVNAVTPAGDPVSDVSTAGTDPDADGDDTDGTEDDDDNPDEDDPTTLTLPPASIGVAKNMTATGTGPFDVTIDYYFENFSTLNISNLSMTDDLDEVFTAGNWSLTSGPTIITGPGTFTVDSAYTGSAANIELLDGGSLAPGETAQIQIRLVVNSPGSYVNQTVVNGEAPDGSPVTDTSTDGTDPDADGDDTDGTVDNDGIPDEDDPSTLDLSSPAGVLGVAKQMSATGNDPYIVTIDYTLENFSGVAISQLSMPDDLDAVFTAGNWSLNSPPVLVSGPATVLPNPSFTGSGTNVDLLAGGSLGALESALIRIELSLTASGRYENQVTVTGEDPSGTTITDVSTDGSDPDVDGDSGDGTVDNDNIPNENEPSILELERPAIGLAKSAEVLSFDPFQVRFTFNLENFGDTNLENVQITDDLDAAFGVDNYSVAEPPVVDSNPGGGLVVNVNFDGSGDQELLGAGSTLPFADTTNTGTVSVVVEIVAAGGYFNTATAQAISSQSGAPVQDVSTDGADPDPDDDGDPGNNSDPTPVNLIRPTLLLSKNVAQDQVSVGDFASYTVDIENTFAQPLENVTLTDEPAPGFTYVVGTGRLIRAGADGELGTSDDDSIVFEAKGTRILQFSNIDFAAMETIRITYSMRVGAGVQPGRYLNRATPSIETVVVGNTATAQIDVIPDPILDKTTVLGKVFLDADRDGWQDPSVATDLALSVVGRGLILSTLRVDRGDGPQTLQELGMLVSPTQGFLLGDLPGRTGAVGPAPTLRVLVDKGTNGFPEIRLTSKEGTQLVMDGAGKVTTTLAGSVAKGRSAQQLTLRRSIEGATVVYTIANAGRAEPGLAGVRLATTTGLVIETDAEGRYHVADVDGGRAEYGRNLVLKVDARSLPPGSQFTTENPRVVHLTSSLMNRFNFGVYFDAAGVAEVAAVSPVASTLRVEKSVRPPFVTRSSAKAQRQRFVLDHVSFASAKADLRPEAEDVIEKVANAMRERPNASARIEGHTDYRPIRTAPFSDNYELSIARAQSVKNALMERYGIAPDRLSVAGFGPDRPVAVGRTAESLQRNRRVEVILFAPPQPVLTDVSTNPSTVTYRIEVSNVGNAELTSLGLEEWLAPGMRYVPGSSRWNDSAVDDPSQSSVLDTAKLMWHFDRPANTTDWLVPGVLEFEALIVQIDPTSPPFSVAEAGWAASDGSAGVAPRVGVPLEIRRQAPEPIPLADEQVFFDTSKADVREDTRMTLDRLIRDMQGFDIARVQLDGHADVRPIVAGPFANNQALSEARVQSVQDYLVGRLDASIEVMSGEGFGDRVPRTPGRSNLALQDSRRVDIQVFGRWQLPEEPTRKSESEFPAMAQARIEHSSTGASPVLGAAKAWPQMGLIPLHGGGAAWASESPVERTARLNVLGPSEIGLVGGSSTQPVRFVAYSNYPSFIDSWELRVYDGRDEDHSRPIGVMQGSGPPATIEWRGEREEGAPDLQAGQELSYVLRVFDVDGNWDETNRRAIFVSDDPEAFDPNRARNDIYGHANLRDQNIPLTGSAIVLQGRDVPADSKVSFAGQPLGVDANGRFAHEWIVPFGQRDMPLTVSAGSDAPVVDSIAVEASPDYGFLVAMANVTVGDNNITGDRSIVDGYYRYDGDLFADGRLAFYGQRLVNGKFHFTGHLDSRTEELDVLFRNLDRRDPQSLFRRLDPDRYYLNYGDGSTLRSDVNTQGRFFGRLAWDKSRLLWGNFATGITGTEFGQFNRSMHGGLLEYRTVKSDDSGESRVAVSGFGSEAPTSFAHNEFLGTGGSLYYLRHTDIVQGSEKVWVEIRDRDTERVVETITMDRGRDYEFDDIQGRLVLSRPLLQVANQAAPSIIRDTPLDGNQVLLMVDYEYVTDGMGDDLTLGARAKVWPVNGVGLGGTIVDEERAGQDYWLAAGDLTLRAAPGTYLKYEYAESEASQAATSLFSDDGGLSFQNTSTALGNTDTKGEAAAVEGRLNLGDFAESSGEATVAGWWRRRSAGFSTARLNGGVETVDYGGELNWSPLGQLTLAARYNMNERAGVGDEERITGQAKVRFGAITVGGELRQNSITPDGGTQTDALLGGGLVGVDVTEGIHIYATGQGVINQDDGYADNALGTLGIRARVSSKLVTRAEGSVGDRGNSVRVGLDVNPNPTHSLYGTYTLSTDRLDGDRGLFTLGQRKSLSNQLSLFTENQFTHGERRSGLSHIYGLNFQPSRDWKAGLTFQRSDLDDRGVGTVDRDAVSANVAYQGDVSKLSAKVELRNDRGLVEQRQYVTTNRADVQLTPGLSVIGKLNFSLTENRDTSTNDAKFAETGVGLAYRPVGADRWNMLLKHTFLYDLSTLAQATGRPDQRTQIVSGEVLYDLSHSVEVGTHLAHRRGEVRLDRDAGDWLRTRANLASLRLRYHLLFNWDAVAEYRWLSVTESEDRRQGVLVALYRHVGNNVKLGVGYNFTDFSDDLSDFDYDNHGWFVNLLGKY